VVSLLLFISNNVDRLLVLFFPFLFSSNDTSILIEGIDELVVIVLEDGAEVVEIHGHMAMFTGNLHVLAPVLEAVAGRALYFVGLGGVLEGADGFLILADLLANAGDHYVVAVAG
jgi:hypothetical protein